MKSSHNVLVFTGVVVLQEEACPVEVVVAAEASEVKVSEATEVAEVVAGAEVAVAPAAMSHRRSWTTSWTNTCRRRNPILTQSWIPTWPRLTLELWGRKETCCA
ncbi:hypothetical protein V1264_005576 [Littorina saxatilis]|uniref:Uncharacterized protein n=1 Tax=Littorina saxatilis TaxID=31220 RepID=A0AAN9AZG3_9CAEN